MKMHYFFFFTNAVNSHVFNLCKQKLYRQLLLNSFSPNYDKGYNCKVRSAS